MNDAGDASAWSAANAKYQDFFREIVTRFEFEDALLIDDRGNVVYSAYKDVDLGTNILTGPYSGSKLHDAYLKAMSANAVDYVGFTDFEFYQPAEMQPTAWMVAPIAPGGKTQGVLALQFPIAKINRLMTFDKQWAEAGLGSHRRDDPRRTRRPDALGLPAVPGESSSSTNTTWSRPAPRPTSPTWPFGRAEPRWCNRWPHRRPGRRRRASREP